MDLEDIERILELVRQHELAEFELERDGLKLRVRKAGAGFPPMAAPVQMTQAPPPNLSAPSPPAAAVPAAESAGEADDTPLELAVVKSPIVGTFYRSAEPG